MSSTEEFWQGPFGDEYNRRNADPKMVDDNEAFFRAALTPLLFAQIHRVVEFGPNIGQNIAALKRIAPFSMAKFTGVEINGDAVVALNQRFPDMDVLPCSMTDRITWEERHDLAISKGVLIHIHPEKLPDAYDNLYHASKRWIFVAEYHNPTPVAVSYRGNEGVLWKRDFALEMLDRFPNTLKMHSQGFAGRRHPHWPQDDLVYTLMEKVRS